MNVLASRMLVRPSDGARSRHFYRNTLGLAVYREFGPPDDPGLVFFLGGGYLEVAGRGPIRGYEGVSLWFQVPDVQAEHDRLRSAGVSILREPVLEPWGLVEMWIEDPDGLRLVIVEVPEHHPLRRDRR